MPTRWSSPSSELIAHSPQEWELTASVAASASLEGALNFSSVNSLHRKSECFKSDSGAATEGYSAAFLESILAAGGMCTLSLTALAVATQAGPGSDAYQAGSDGSGVDDRGAAGPRMLTGGTYQGECTATDTTVTAPDEATTIATQADTSRARPVRRVKTALLSTVRNAALYYPTLFTAEDLVEQLDLSRAAVAQKMRQLLLLKHRHMGRHDGTLPSWEDASVAEKLKAFDRRRPPPRPRLVATGGANAPLAVATNARTGAPVSACGNSSAAGTAGIASTPSSPRGVGAKIPEDVLLQYSQWWLEQETIIAKKENDSNSASSPQGGSSRSKASAVAPVLSGPVPAALHHGAPERSKEVLKAPSSAAKATAVAAAPPPPPPVSTSNEEAALDDSGSCVHAFMPKGRGGHRTLRSTRRSVTDRVMGSRRSLVSASGRSMGNGNGHGDSPIHDNRSPEQSHSRLSGRGRRRRTRIIDVTPVAHYGVNTPNAPGAVTAPHTAPRRVHAMLPPPAPPAPPSTAVVMTGIHSSNNPPAYPHHSSPLHRCDAIPSPAVTTTNGRSADTLSLGPPPPHQQQQQQPISSAGAATDVSHSHSPAFGRVMGRDSGFLAEESVLLVAAPALTHTSSGVSQRRRHRPPAVQPSPSIVLAGGGGSTCGSPRGAMQRVALHQPSPVTARSSRDGALSAFSPSAEGASRSCELPWCAGRGTPVTVTGTTTTAGTTRSGMAGLSQTSASALEVSSNQLSQQPQQLQPWSSPAAASASPIREEDRASCLALNRAQHRRSATAAAATSHSPVSARQGRSDPREAYVPLAPINFEQVSTCVSASAVLPPPMPAFAAPQRTYKDHSQARSTPLPRGQKVMLMISQFEAMSNASGGSPLSYPRLSPLARVRGTAASPAVSSTALPSAPRSSSVSTNGSQHQSPLAQRSVSKR